MDYDSYINDIIQRRGRTINTNEYTETHHIIPKCMGGDDSSENLIELYGREHMVAHKLLYKKYPNNSEIIFAYWMMAHTGAKERECSPEEYEEARKAFSQIMSGENNPAKRLEVREKLSNALSGKPKSEEHKRKLSEYCGEKHPKYGTHHSEETRQKISKALTGKRFSAERKKNLSKAHDYEKKPVVAIDKNTKEIMFVCSSIKDAERWTGIGNSDICQCCKGNVKSAGGYIWKYAQGEK